MKNSLTICIMVFVYHSIEVVCNFNSLDHQFASMYRCVCFYSVYSYFTQTYYTSVNNCLFIFIDFTFKNLFAYNLYVNDKMCFSLL